MISVSAGISDTHLERFDSLTVVQDCSAPEVVIQWCNDYGVRLAVQEPGPFRFQVIKLTSSTGKLVAYVPLSPSSIIWYRSRGGDALRLGR